MKVVVRNPSLPVLVGWILLGFSLRKSTRLRRWHAGIETSPLATVDLKAGFLERLRNTRHLAESSTELGLRP